MTQVTIKKGDTLWGLTGGDQAAMRAIAKANGIKNPNRLKIGTVLNIPDPVPHPNLRPDPASIQPDPMMPTVGINNPGGRMTTGGPTADVLGNNSLEGLIAGSRPRGTYRSDALPPAATGPDFGETAPPSPAESSAALNRKAFTEGRNIDLVRGMPGAANMDPVTAGYVGANSSLTEPFVLDLRPFLAKN